MTLFTKSGCTQTVCDFESLLCRNILKKKNLDFPLKAQETKEDIQNPHNKGTMQLPPKNDHLSTNVPSTGLSLFTSTIANAGVAIRLEDKYFSDVKRLTTGQELVQEMRDIVIHGTSMRVPAIPSSDGVLKDIRH